MDFRYLNEACRNDEFSLPKIDMLVDATAGHSTFLDGFSGYNQIKIDPTDAKKTAFGTHMANCHYTVMPFELRKPVPPIKEP